MLKNFVVATILALSIQLPILAKMPIKTNWYTSRLTIAKEWKLTNVQELNCGIYYCIYGTYSFASKKWDFTASYSGGTLRSIYLAYFLNEKLSIKQQLDFLMKALTVEFGTDFIKLNEGQYYWTEGPCKVIADYQSDTKQFTVFLLPY